MTLVQNLNREINYLNTKIVEATVALEKDYCKAYIEGQAENLYRRKQLKFELELVILDNKPEIKLQLIHEVNKMKKDIMKINSKSTKIELLDVEVKVMFIKIIKAYLKDM